MIYLINSYTYIIYYTIVVYVTFYIKSSVSSLITYFQKVFIRSKYYLAYSVTDNIYSIYGILWIRFTPEVWSKLFNYQRTDMSNYITTTLKQKSKRRATNVYLTLKDKKALMEECGIPAMVLFEFYLSKSSLPNYEYSDGATAKALGWTIHTVKNHRLKLQRAGYFLKTKAIYTDGRSLTHVLLGKDVVTSAKEQVALAQKEPNETITTDTVIINLFDKET